MPATAACLFALLTLLAPAAAGAGDRPGVSSVELPTDASGRPLLPLESGLVPLEVKGLGPLEIHHLRYSPPTGELSFELLNWGPEIVTAYGVVLVRPDHSSHALGWEAIDSVPPGRARLYPLRALEGGYIGPYSPRPVTLALDSDGSVAALELGVHAVILGDGTALGDRRTVEDWLASRRRDREALERWLPELRRVLEADGEEKLLARRAELEARIREAVPADGWHDRTDVYPEAEPVAVGALGELLGAVEAAAGPEDCTGRVAEVCDFFDPRRFLEDVVAHHEERLVVLREHTIAVTTAAPAPGDG